MSPKLKKFIHSWIVNTVAVLVAVKLMPGIHYEKPVDLFGASLLLGILNAFLKPTMMRLALPLVIFTLGLFRFVINALLLYLVGVLPWPHFHVDNFWSAFVGALIISVVSIVLNLLTGNSSAQARVEVRGQRRPPPGPPDTGSGPVIDV
jgi:putative membrane protein